MTITHQCCIKHPYKGSQMSASQWQLDFCVTNACECLYPYHDQFKETDTFLDIGCGEGFITSWLAEQVPRGRVLGIDFLESAIFNANEKYAKYENLHFKVADASNLKLDDKFDWIVAFNSLHWLKEDAQLRFLKNIRSNLTKNGKLLLTLGMRHEPIWTAIDKVANNKKWSTYLKDYVNPRAFYTAETYSDLLIKAGISSHSLKTKFLTHFFTDQQEFKDCVISWLPQITHISEENKPIFINEITDEYIKLQPINSNGNIEITFNNLEIEASISYC